MATTSVQAQDWSANSTGQPDAARGLALVRLTIGAMLVWVFFENLGKGLYTPAGYAGLIRHYIEASHSPTVWKAVMGLAANHATAPDESYKRLAAGDPWVDVLR